MTDIDIREPSGLNSPGSQGLFAPNPFNISEHADYDGGDRSIVYSHGQEGKADPRDAIDHTSAKVSALSQPSFDLQLSTNPFPELPIPTFGDDLLGDEIIPNPELVLIGGVEDETLQGGDRNDQISGGKGNDSLLGLAGFDTLRGGPGDDLLRGGSSGDLLLGGAGHDTLVGGIEDGSLIFPKNFPFLFSGDTLRGGDGDDILRAGSVFGSLLVGGQGEDTLSGNSGADRFRLQVNRGADTIRRFQAIPVADFTDVFELGAGLQFDDLSFIQSGRDTLISARNQLLATVERTTVAQIDNAALFA